MSDTSEKRYRPNVAIIVTDGQGRVLSCRRAKPTYQTVQTVQGGIDPGETAEQAARRELQEELGITDADYELLARAPGVYRYDWPSEYLASIPQEKNDYVGQDQHFFLARVPSNTPFRLDAHYREFSEVWWGTPQELVDRAWEGKRPGIEAALRFFGLL